MDTEFPVLGYRTRRDAVGGHDLVLGVQALRAQRQEPRPALSMPLSHTTTDVP